MHIPKHKYRQQKEKKVICHWKFCHISDFSQNQPYFVGMKILLFYTKCSEDVFIQMPPNQCIISCSIHSLYLIKYIDWLEIRVKTVFRCFFSRNENFHASKIWQILTKVWNMAKFSMTYNFFSLWCRYLCFGIYNCYVVSS